MERFLNEETLRVSRLRVRRYIRIFYALAGLAAVLFIVLCLLTRTGNAGTMLRLSMCVLISAGWILIAIRLFAVEPAKAEDRHLSGLAAAEPSVREGRFFLSSDAFRIPKSVKIRKVRLETDPEPLSLNLNVKCAGKAPADGSLVRVEIRRKFITGLDVLEAAPDQAPATKQAGWKTLFRSLGRFLLPAILWAMLAAVFTGFVFSHLTDTAPEYKIVLYADCAVQNAPELAERLEKELNGSVRMVKIHPFSYAMFDSVRLKQADLYIVPESRKAEYSDWFTDEEGRTVYDPGAGLTVADAYFQYDSAGVGTDVYRLYFGAGSVHLEDGLARKAAEMLMTVTDTAKEALP